MAQDGGLDSRCSDDGVGVRSFDRLRMKGKIPAEDEGLGAQGMKGRGWGRSLRLRMMVGGSG